MQSISPPIAPARCLLGSVQARARVHILFPSSGSRSWMGLPVLALALLLALSPRAASAQAERLSLRRALDNALAQNKRLVSSRYRIFGNTYRPTHGTAAPFGRTGFASRYHDLSGSSSYNKSQITDSRSLAAYMVYRLGQA